MKLTKWLGVVALAAPVHTQSTLGCDCIAPTVIQYITVAGPTVIVSSCPDTVSAAPAVVSSTKPYICAGDPCTSWVDNHRPASTDILTYKPTTVTQYPVPPSTASAIPTIHLTSTRTKTYTVKTCTTITASTDDHDEDDTSTCNITAAPLSQTITTSEEPELTTTTTEFLTVTDHPTITFTHTNSMVVTSVHLGGIHVSSHGHGPSHGHSFFTGFGSHGWNLTSSTACLNSTARQTYRRPPHGGHRKSSAKWHTITLPWTASHNTSSAYPLKTSSVDSISWDLGISTPARSHNKASSAKLHKTSSSESTSWDLRPSTSIYPLTMSTIRNLNTPTRQHKASSHSWNLQFSSSSTTNIPSAIHHTSSLLATPYINTTSATFFKRIVTIAEPSPTNCHVPQDELGNFTFSYKKPSTSSAEVAAFNDQVTSANHLFANGYAGLGEVESGTAFSFQQGFVMWYEAAHSIFPGGVGVGAEHRQLDMFKFDAFGVRLGCLGKKRCDMRAVGYKLNTTDGTEIEGSSQWLPSVVACPTHDCKLTPIELSDDFHNLTSIVFLAGDERISFLMANLELGWTKHDCRSAMERYKTKRD